MPFFPRTETFDDPALLAEPLTLQIHGVESGNAPANFFFGGATFSDDTYIP